MAKRIICFIFFLLISFSSLSLCASASYEPDFSRSDVKAYYLYNPENNLYMAEHGADKVIAPAATVKMMTACIALESGVNENKLIYVTKAMLEGVSGRVMNLKAGDVLSVSDLLYATVCGGYNDAATVLAYSVSSDLSRFIGLMNEKARSLKMNATNYLNVTGMQEIGMTTCVIDIARLASYLLKNERFVEIASSSSYKMSDASTCDRRTISNRSSLFSQYRGISNFATGSGDFGGGCVIYYRGDSLSFICIVMDASPRNEDDDEIEFAESAASSLLSHALYEHSFKSVLSEKDVFVSLPVALSSTSEDIALYPASKATVYVPSDVSDTDLNISYYLYSEELTAPLKAGDEVGRIMISYDGRMLASVPLIVKEDVDQSGFLVVLELIKDYVRGPAFISSCIIFVCLMIAYYFYVRRTRKITIHRSSNTMK